MVREQGGERREVPKWGFIPIYIGKDMRVYASVRVRAS